MMNPPPPGHSFLAPRSYPPPAIYPMVVPLTFTISSPSPSSLGTLSSPAVKTGKRFSSGVLPASMPVVGRNHRPGNSEMSASPPSSDHSAGSAEETLDSGQEDPAPASSRKLSSPSSPPECLERATDLTSKSCHNNSKSTRPTNQTVNGTHVTGVRSTTGPGNGVLPSAVPQQSPGHLFRKHHTHQRSLHENAGRESVVLVVRSSGSEHAVPSHPPPLSSCSSQPAADFSGTSAVLMAQTAAAGSGAAARPADPLNQTVNAAATTGGGGGVCMEQLTGSSATVHCKPRGGERRESGSRRPAAAGESERTSDSPAEVTLLRSLSSSSSSSSPSLSAVVPAASGPPAAASTTTTTTTATATSTANAAAVSTGGSHRQIGRLRRFLTTLHQFTCDISPEVGAKVHALILNLVNCSITIEDFHQKIQEITQYPLRAYVVPFLRLHLPIVQNEIMLFARLSKLTPSQYLLQNESLILDPASAVAASPSQRLVPSSSSSAPVLVGEAFEIFQPTDRSSPTSSSLANSSARQHLNSIASHSAMGVKDGTSSSSVKRRFSPESRKENGFDDHHPRSHLHPPPAASSHHPEPPAKRHHAVVVSHNLVARNHLGLPNANPVHAGPLHPLHSNASSAAAPASAPVTSSSGHQNHMRAALMEQAAHEAAAAAAGIFRVNGTSSPSVSNGHPVRDTLSNGRSPAVSLDHHLLQMSERFDRDRVYSSLEKELLSRNPANHSNKMIISPPAYTDVLRSYSEEITREAEEEWRNIHTMLNCILGMVDKTKRALAILQQRTMDNAVSVWTPGRSASAAGVSRIIPSPVQNSFPSHTSNHISPAAHHQHQQAHSKSQQPNTHSPPTVIKQMNRNDMIHTGPHSQSMSDGRLQAVSAAADSSRSARAPVSNGRDVPNEVKRQPASELVKAHAASESETGELVTVERMRMERLICEVRRQAAEEAVLTLSKQEDSSESCWNCGRKAAETCSGCNVARYCGSFCQHKDWENHHRVCGQGISLSTATSSNLNTSSDSATSSPCNNSSSTPAAANPVPAAGIASAVSSGSGTAAGESQHRPRIRGSPSPPVSNSRHPVRICINDKN